MPGDRSRDSLMILQMGFLLLLVAVLLMFIWVAT